MRELSDGIGARYRVRRKLATTARAGAKQSNAKEMCSFRSRRIADSVLLGHDPQMLFQALKRLLLAPKTRTAQEALEAGLDVEPADRNLAFLVPIILPVDLLDTDWPGPIVRIGNLPFCAAWAFRGKTNLFFYMSHRDADYWNDAEPDWRAVAFANLSRLAHDRPASGFKSDDNGNPFIKILLHDDAVGPSRLLVPHLFDEDLGENYEVAIPEQTCAIAYRKNLTQEQKADVDRMINGCLVHGTEPTSPDRFAASAFWGFA